MESLKLNVFTLISKQVHHHLEVGLVGDVSRHHVEVCPVEEDFAQELERLSFRDIVVGKNERRKGGEELVGN